MKKKIKDFISLVVLLFTAPLAGYSATEVGNFTDFTNAVTAKDAEISVTGNITDVNATTSIDYTTSVSSSVEGTIRNISNPNQNQTIFNVTGAGNLTVKNMSFSQNAALGGTSSMITNSNVFNAVSSNFSSGTSSVLQNTINGEMNISGSTVTGNSAATRGAGVDNAGVIVISNTTFSNNKLTGANSTGGGLYSSGTATITNGIFKSNTASNGAGIYNTGSLISTGTSYTGNIATGNGGAVYNSNQANGATFSNVKFGDETEAGKNSAVNGGAIYNTANSKVTIKDNTSFNNNTATKSGGGLYNLGTADIQNGTTFTGNTAGENGAGVYNAGTYTTTGTTYTNNTATNNGGAISNAGTLNVSNGTFTSNNAVNGAGIYNSANSTVTIKDNSAINNNTATKGGGGLYNLGTADIQNGTTFTGNTAGENGGGLYAGGQTTINGAKFTNNSATLAGGGLYVAEGITATDTNSTYEGNTAANGAGVYNAGTYTTTGTTYTNNTATNNGGAISNAGTLNVNNGTFASNNAVNGAGVHNTGIFTTTGTTYTNNTATNNGGAINNVGTLNVNGGTFTSNNAVNGGAIYNSNTLTISGNTSFESNNASKEGGAIYNSGNLYLAPNTGETIIFAENTNGANNSNAIYNSGNLILNGSGNVLTRDSFSGNRTLVKNGSGEFTVKALDGGVADVSQDVIQITAGTLNVGGSTGTSKITGATEVTIVNPTFNLNGNSEISSKTLSITSSNINATGTGNKLSGDAVYIAGTDTSSTNLFVGGSTNDSSLTIAPSNNGLAVISDKVNTQVKNGSLILNADNGNITFSENNENGYSVKLGTNGNLTITADNAENKVLLNNVVVSVDDSASLSILGKINYDMDMDFSGASGTYTQDGATVNVTDKFFKAKEGSVVKGNGTIRFNEGATISTNGLKIENANIEFNENSQSAVNGAKFSADGGYIVYGDNSISLSQANVTLNDGFAVTQSAADDTTGFVEIGTGTQGLKELTLINSGIGEGAKLNLSSGKLTISGTTNAGLTSAINLDTNSVVNIQDATQKLFIGSDFSGSGVINNTDTAIFMAGNSGQFSGTYNQTGGETEFLAGSTYFGDGFSQNLSNGSLIVHEGVNFINTQDVYVPVTDSKLEVATYNSTADLSTGNVTIDPNKVVHLNLTNSALSLDKYTNVTASTGTVTIGDDGTGANLITTLSMGQEDYTSPEKSVTFVSTKDTSIKVINPDNKTDNGIITLGDNVDLTPLSATNNSLELGKNTNLILTMTDKAKMHNSALHIDLKTEDSSYAEDNGYIIKEGNGKLYLSGKNDGYHGKIDLRNGQIALASAQSVIGADSRYDLSNTQKDARTVLTPLHDTNVNPDLDIIAVSMLDNAKADVYNLSSNGTVTVAGNTVLDNNSALNISASKKITLKDTLVGSASDDSNAAITLAAPSILFENTSPVLLKGVNSQMTLLGDTVVANDFTIQKATLNLFGNMHIGGNYKVGSTVNMINNLTHTQSVAGNMTLTGNTDYKIDINGATLQSDKVVVSGTINAAQPTNLDISQVHVVYDPKYDNTIYTVFNDAKNSSGQEIDPNVVFTSSTGLINGHVGIYTMKSADNGKYLLSRIGYQPYVLGGDVAAQVGIYTQMNAYNTAFSNADALLSLPKKEREAYKMANKYAAAADELAPNLTNDPMADTTDTTTDVKTEEKVVFEADKLNKNNVGGWFRPYGSFERVKFKEGPEVGNNMYGAYAGVDSKIMDLGNGYEGSVGFYAGYDGSRQTYDGVGIYQNGGTIGITGSVYKGDFFSLSTANIGASGADQTSIMGSADFWMLRAGIANKTGYNWDLADGKFIIQPHILMSLSGANVFPYSSAFAKMDGEFVLAYQVAPGIKLIGNFENGWQPYLSVDMNWIAGGRSTGNVNGVALPGMYSTPWLEYGLGIQKRWGTRFTGYGQAMFRSIGRNGVAFSAGMRYRVGDGR